MSQINDFQGSESVYRDYPTIVARGVQELDELSRSIAADAQAMEDQPVAQPVADAFRAISTDIRVGTELAERLIPILRQAHERDIQRHEAPRSREDMWDIRKNQQ